MFGVFASSFSVVANEGEDATTVYARVQRILVTQLQQFAGKHDPSAIFTGNMPIEWQAPDGTATVVFDAWQDSEDAAYRRSSSTLTYQHQGHDWQVTVNIGSTPDDDKSSVSAVWSRAALLGGTLPMRKLPPLLAAFAGETCRPLNMEVPFTVTPLQAQDIHEFCRSALEDEKRSLPLILVSPTGEGLPLVDNEFLARSLFGLALVYNLTDCVAVEALLDCLPESMACYDGAVRIYWPNFRPNDRASQHKYWLAKSIVERGQIVVVDEIFRTIAASSLRYFEMPQQLKKLEQNQRRADRRDREAQYVRSLGVESDRDEYRGFWEITHTENESLKDEKEELERARNALLAGLQELQDELDEIKKEKEHFEGRSRHYEDECIRLKQEAEQLDTQPKQKQLFPILLSHKADATYRNATPAERKDMDPVLDKLSRLSRGERRQSSTMKRENSDCWTYPSGSNKNGLRVIAFEQAEDGIYICEICKHNRTYEEHHRQGVLRKDYPIEQFVAWELLSRDE